MLSIISISCNKTIHLGSLYTCDGFSKDIRQSIDTKSFAISWYYSCFKAKECGVYPALSHSFFYSLMSAIDESLNPPTREPPMQLMSEVFPKIRVDIGKIY